eukprot:GEMP01075141.1.p2 GENE.GEMP01075141.1~~GEMP01075141.1.p2  ORF type:complete len:120 (+),score=11.76 GEMP01075141.1:665-1024(+)
MTWGLVSITGANQAMGCVGLDDHCQYKYLAFLNGNTYSSRLKYELLCGSVVFASPPDWVEWWSEQLKPSDYVQVFQKYRRKKYLLFWSYVEVCRGYGEKGEISGNLHRLDAERGGKCTF